jgi:hypothetical protein
MRGLIAVFLSLLSTGAIAGPGLQVAVAPDAGSQAWWMHTTLVPGGDAVRGIPLREFDAGWCAADEITLDAFPAAIRTDGSWPLDRLDPVAGSPFALGGDFGAGEPLEVILGAYRTCSGETRNFLAVIAPERSDARVVQVESISADRAVFQYLRADPSAGFRIFSCMACDDMGRLYLWNAASGKFEKQPYVDGTG